MPDTRFIIVIVNYKKTGKNHGIPDNTVVIITVNIAKGKKIFLPLLCNTPLLS